MSYIRDNLRYGRNGLLSVVVGAAFLAAIVFFAEHTEAQVASATTTESASDPNVATSTPAQPWYASDWISGSAPLEQGDFVVGPGKIEVTVAPGQSVTRIITLTNRISDQRSFEFAIEDITGGDDGASTKLIEGEYGPYTLRDYLSIPGKKITLGLGERAQIPITITIPPNAEPGGRYGSVLISTVQDQTESQAIDSSGVRSPIIARLGVLFFVTVPGDAVREGELVDFSLIGKPWWYEAGPIQLGISYENRGSLHLNPYGEVRVTNMFGEEVGYVQLDPWFVLPKALRTREVTWDREFLLGRYTVTASINRGYDDIVDERTVTFWVLPWKIMGGVFLGFFTLFFLLRLFFRSFEFKRRSP